MLAVALVVRPRRPRGTHLPSTWHTPAVHVAQVELALERSECAQRDLAERAKRVRADEEAARKQLAQYDQLKAEWAQAAAVVVVAVVVVVV